jgi:hypothetical protein
VITVAIRQVAGCAGLDAAAAIACGVDLLHAQANDRTLKGALHERDS